MSFRRTLAQKSRADDSLSYLKGLRWSFDDIFTKQHSLVDTAA